MDEKVNKIVIADMDGTITAARTTIDDDNTQSIIDFLSDSTDNIFAIVSGSSWNLIKEQCHKFFLKVANLNLFSQVKILPCNGTQKVSYDEKEKTFTLDTSISMKDEIGIDCFNELIFTLMSCHSEIIKGSSQDYFSGTFLEYRGSCLNWAIPGRNTSREGRARFAKRDQKFKIRQRLIAKVSEILNPSVFSKLEFKIGGEISIDILPRGWNKTYCMNHLPSNWSKIYFLGDRCLPGQNDYEIYKLIHDKKEGKSFIIEDHENFKNIMKLITTER